MSTLRTRAAVLACLLVASAAVQAHDDATLDKTQAPHGGQLRMAGAFHYELVVVKDSQAAKDNPVQVYVTDHAGGKIPVQGASGSIRLMWGKNSASAALTPDGDNRLKGNARYASTADLKAVVSVTLPGQPVEQTRFTPLAPAADPHAGH